MGSLFIVFWVIIISIGILILGKINKQDNSKFALDIARERYARGEISQEELSQIKKELI